MSPSACFGLARRGELDEHGKPALRRMALVAPVFADEIRVVSPPWWAHRAAFRILAPIARLRGYTAPDHQQHPHAAPSG